ncbi:hypothetical protein FDP41_002279 [Naegleria fowleri]|uniref:Transcription factor CBF/NF-Y/archaeal histone domain-containing protein n=1 Tax=Naegleria fowleri TaxID=5763 RepID=A0A6A5BZP1_NAEFO|nr:uncharacterized protein FDP41_002279 [Naegleria fowleri]KAF0978459.1 hypothetical protein FDP41_002279 [Naegleria fowleri]
MSYNLLPNGMVPQQQHLSSSSQQPPPLSSIAHNPSLMPPQRSSYHGYPPPPLSSESSAHLPSHHSGFSIPPNASYNNGSGIHSLPPTTTTVSHHSSTLAPPVSYYRQHHQHVHPSSHTGNIFGTHPPQPGYSSSHPPHPAGAQYSTHPSSMIPQNPHSMIPTRSSPQSSSSPTSAEEERQNNNRYPTHPYSPWYANTSAHHGHPPPPMYTSHPHSFNPHSASSNLLENGGSMIPPSSQQQHHHLFKPHPGHMGGNGVMKYGASISDPSGRPFTDYQQIVHSNSNIMQTSSTGVDPYHSTTIPQPAMHVWKKLIFEMVQNSGSKKPKNELPLARIKKIMKSDEEVRTKTMISAEAPVLFAKACEMFIIELTLHAWVHTEEAKRRTLQRNDIAAAIGKTDVFDFLIDIVPRETEKVQHTSHKANDDPYTHSVSASEIARHAATTNTSGGKSTIETNAEDEISTESDDDEDEDFGVHMLIDTQSTKEDAPSTQSHLANIPSISAPSGHNHASKPMTDNTALQPQHVSALLQPSLIPSTNSNTSHNFNPSVMISTGSCFSLASSSSSTTTANSVLGGGSRSNNTNESNNSSVRSPGTHQQHMNESTSNSTSEHQDEREHGNIGSRCLPSMDSMVSFSSVESTNESSASHSNQPHAQVTSGSNVGTEESSHHHEEEQQTKSTIQPTTNNHPSIESYSFPMFQ